jgi:hypothetical protein
MVNRAKIRLFLDLSSSRRDARGHGSAYGRMGVLAIGSRCDWRDTPIRRYAHPPTRPSADTFLPTPAWGKTSQIAINLATAN